MGKEKGSEKVDKFSRHKFFTVLTVSILFICLAWYSYSTQVNNIDEANLPIIYAPNTVKSKPGNPGGFVVANRDKDIYDHISGKKVKNKKAKASHSSEDPVSKQELDALITKQLKEEKVSNNNNPAP